MSLGGENTTTADRDARRRGPTFVPTVPVGARGASFRPPAKWLVGGDAVCDAQADVPSV